MLNVSTHRLTHLTLINWYLFEAQDIAIKESSVLFRGVNGAGKSSLVDAIQTLLAGGDETALAMNAASSGAGTRSGRTIKSYIEGVVAEDNGTLTTKPRVNPNAYLCMTFTDEAGEPYCFGIAMSSTAGSTKVRKNFFILKNAELNSGDFINADGMVMPWSHFERELKARFPLVQFPKSSRDYRTYCSELMSAPGANQQIQPDMMWRALKNGIAFREQKSISDFTRNYILPSNPIDVNRIENDFNEYQEILRLIERAEEEMKTLKVIIDKYKRHETQLGLRNSFEWVVHEADYLLLDTLISDLEEKNEALKAEHEAKSNEAQKLATQLPKLERKRDEAYLAFKNSSIFDADKDYNEGLDAAQQQIRDCRTLIANTRSEIARLLQIEAPATSSSMLKEALRNAREELTAASQLSTDITASDWPKDQAHIDAIMASLNAYREIKNVIQHERDRLYARRETAKEEWDTLKSAVDKMSQGEAQLMPSTEKVISLLELHGIQATPVCELCTVTDPSWQEAIESYLGNNRESLVVDPSDFSQAIAIYRQEMKDRNHGRIVRQAKLINPDKDFGFSGTVNPGSAASLIESEHPVVCRYLRGLLHNVLLVDTEAELRRERRAITKDGMVAANGTVSGGNRFKWLLLGKEARQRDAENKAAELEAARAHYHQLDQSYQPINKLNSSFNDSINSAFNTCLQVPEAMNKEKAAHQDIELLKAKYRALEESPEQALKEAYDHAKQAVSASNTQSIELSKDIGALDTKIQQMNTELPKLKENIESVSAKRTKCESAKDFNAEAAAAKMEEITESVGGEDYKRIKSVALIKRDNAETAANKAREEASSAKQSYCYEFDPQYKQELMQMNPSDSLRSCMLHYERIESAQLVGFRDQAQDACDKMLANFRSEVVAKLKESFQKIDRTFSVLNKQLKTLSFNNNRYRFIYPQVETESLRSVYEFVTDSSDLDTANLGSMFDDKRDHPAVDIIQDVLTSGRLNEISDYRNFFTYDIIAKDTVTETERKFSELLNTGSGGEKQAPFYVALGASFMSAYKIQKMGDNVVGGAALAVFDEAFSKMDGNNAHSALNFFKEIGLQVILAAPPDSEVKVGPYVDKVYSVLRSGNNVYIDYHVYTEKGKNLLESDDPDFHPELVEAQLAGVHEKYGAQKDTSNV